MAVTKKLEDFSRDWVFVDIGHDDEELLELPSERPEKLLKAWGQLPAS